MKIDPPRSPYHKFIYLGVIFVFILVLIFLSLYNQPYYPRTWLDEGFTLQGAINLNRYRQYAMLSSEGFRMLDQPLIANGPGIVIPIAIGFKILGIGLIQARIVMAIFLTTTSLLFLTLTQKLYGLVAAFISILFLFGLPSEGYLVYGREAIGIIPAFTYFLIGLFFFKRMLDQKKLYYSFITGSFWGLALITKAQYLLLVPTLIVILILDFFYYQKIGSAKIIAIGFMFLLIFLSWNVYQLISLGYDNYITNINAIRSSSAVTVTAFHISRIPGNIWYLFRSGCFLSIGPVIVYVLRSFKKKGNINIFHMFLLIFIVLWLFWYAFISVGWARYSFDAYAISTILIGKVVVDIINTIKSPSRLNFMGISNKYSGALSFSLLAVFLVIPILGIGKHTFYIVDHADRSAFEFSDFLQKNVRPGVVVESWEWELDTLVNIKFHHPSNVWVDKFTAKLQFGEPLNSQYNPFVYMPGYLIDGPFSKWTGIYKDILASNCCLLVKSIGDYDLYHVDDR